MANSLKAFMVLSPISVMGEITRGGMVDLDPDHPITERFLAMDEPPIADPDTTPQEESTDGKKSGATDGAGATGQGGSGSETVTQAKIVEAIGTLEPGNEKHWTKGNLPDTNVLSGILNHKISAAERDEAWKVFQVERDGNN